MDVTTFYLASATSHYAHRQPPCSVILASAPATSSFILSISDRRSRFQGKIAAKRNGGLAMIDRTRRSELVRLYPMPAVDSHATCASCFAVAVAPRGADEDDEDNRDRKMFKCRCLSKFGTPLPRMVSHTEVSQGEE
ncbi:hypothetical protein PIB30_063336 [Stylosanthes scabra]|uniref:Uncharacterized protein n=1 Tax=Stylosanthes scabra TaxID=79078 RepID=A0ABU6VJS9_9FABA|nr:hypothetical protein [Stylosanthes scabra]